MTTPHARSAFDLDAAEANARELLEEAEFNWNAQQARLCNDVLALAAELRRERGEEGR
jgi:hypothetical protein